jgi:signal transduction histidine kinase
MMNNTVSEHVVRIVWDYINSGRGIAQPEELFLSALYVLYGYHKQYLKSSFLKTDQVIYMERDEISSQLFEYVVPFKRHQEHLLTELYWRVSSVDFSDFEEIYPSLLIDLYTKCTIDSGKYSGAVITPDEINTLMAYFINREKCSKVFDPFCGVASILPKLNCSFIGQELNPRTALLARLVIDACGRYDSSLYEGDSLSFKTWQNTCADAVASCPPIGQKVHKMMRYSRSNEQEESTYAYEVMLRRALEKDTTKLAIVLEAYDVCVREGSESQLRTYLLNHNYLDTIIALPANILYNTSIPCVLIVCKKDREENDPVTFISAETYIKSNGRFKRVLDVERLLAEIEKDDSSDIVKLTRKEILENDYNLSPLKYQKVSCDESAGQQIVELKTLLDPQCGDLLYERVKVISNYVSPADYSREYMDVLLNVNKTIQITDDNLRMYRRYSPTSGNAYMLFIPMSSSVTNTNFKMALHTSEVPFVCTQSISVFKVNTELVLPEYLAYILLSQQLFRYGFMRVERYMDYPIVIDSIDQQKEIVAKIKQQYHEQIKKEHEADEQRLGIKQNISDLEHLLGTPQFKINQIIGRLERMSPDATNYAATVKSLRDNMDYMSRLIRFNNAKIDSTLFNMREGSIIEFVKDYADGWRNYGGNYFELTITNELQTDSMVVFDKNMLTVMLDAILSNAVRHGFMKDKTHTEHNRVDINLLAVSYMDKPYLQMRVVNNGEPMKDGFTIKDYTSRGRFSAQTGRSGLGGYHVYQVVKGHNGFLYLDSNNVWNMVVEILLPLCSDTSVNDLIEYEHGQDCI